MIAATGGFARALSALVLIVSAVLLVISLAGLIVVPADSLNIVAPFWWAACTLALALIAALVRPRRKAAILMLSGYAVLGAILFWPLLASSSPSPAGKQARLVTYNMYGLNPRAEEAAEWIVSQNPDFVVLLEATPFHHKAIDRIRERLPYVYNCSQKGRCSTLLFSRIPAQQVWPLARGDADNRRALSAITARFAFGGNPLSITAVHLKHPWPLDDRTAQMDELASALSAYGRDGVMTGDFNSTPWTFAVRSLAASGDLHLASGASGTWPAHFPAFMRLPLDQVYLGRCIARTAVRHGPAFSSDHLPVVTDLAIAAC